MTPSGPDRRHETAIRFLILLAMSLALHCAGWSWEQVGTFYELLAATTVLAGALDRRA